MMMITFTIIATKKQVAVDHLLSALLIPGDDTARFCRFAH